MSAVRQPAADTVAALELFVWYRCSLAEAATVGRAARTLLGRLATDFGVRGRLLQRCDGECTWMEHYALDGGSPELPSLLDAMARHWAAGLPQRHIERFAALADHLAA